MKRRHARAKSGRDLAWPDGETVAPRRHREVFMKTVLSGMIVIVAMSAISVPARGAAARSPALAAELTTLLQQQKLDAIAAADPDAPDRFVAALAFPKVQLLVVSAKYPAPTLVQQQIATKAYRDAYLALQQSGIADGKVFVQDLGADGLSGSDAQGVDVVYENVVNQTVFDGAPEKHKLTKSAYDEKLEASDATYSRMLTLLIDQLKGTPTR
jgi:hypothetical protein